MTKDANNQTNDAPKIIRIECFRSGDFKPMVGDAISYSADDLSGIVTSYDPVSSPAPVVVGHPQTDSPAFGWVRGFEYDAEADRLFAEAELTDDFAGCVSAGHYKNVSMSFFKPDAPNNPVQGSWYPKHLGFLGAAAPAVSGLTPVSFAGGADEAVVFVGPISRRIHDVAGVFQKLREFFIDEFGLEKADTALPDWEIRWLSDANVDDDDVQSDTNYFSENKDGAVTMTPEEIAAKEAELKAREDAANVREAEFAEADTKRREADNAAFAEALVKEGRLLPVHQAQAVAILNTLPADQDVSFAGDDGKSQTQNAAEAFKALMQAQPVQVEFAAQDMGEDPSQGGAVSFASDGRPVDADSLALDARAEAYMSQHPGTDYLDAVRAVS